MNRLQVIVNSVGSFGSGRSLLLFIQGIPEQLYAFAFGDVCVEALLHASSHQDGVVWLWPSLFFTSFKSLRA